MLKKLLLVGLVIVVVVTGLFIVLLTVIPTNSASDRRFDDGVIEGDDPYDPRFTLVSIKDVPLNTLADHEDGSRATISIDAWRPAGSIRGNPMIVLAIDSDSMAPQFRSNTPQLVFSGSDWTVSTHLLGWHSSTPLRDGVREYIEIIIDPDDLSTLADAESWEATFGEVQFRSSPESQSSIRALVKHLHTTQPDDE